MCESRETEDQNMTPEERRLSNEIDRFLLKNFPQIQIHGGDFDIIEVDTSDGYAHISLTGACSGCSISPMTIERIRSRLPDDVDRINMVKVETSGSDVPRI